MILSYCKRNIVRIFFYAAAFILSLPAVGASEVITLKDGTKAEDSIIKLEDGILYLEKSGEVNTDDVEDVYFSKKEQKEEVKAAVDVEEIKAIMSEAKELEERFPGHNGLVLLDDGYHEYNDDGTHLYRYHYRFKVLKDVKKREANVTFYFDEGRERINILLARTISADGEVFNLDPAGIKISTPGGSARHFSSYKTLSFMLPNVEVGSIIEYIMETDEYNPFEKKFFFPRFGFYGDDPTLSSRLTVVIPKNEKLYYVFRNFDEEHKKPETSESDGKKSYVWEYKDIEPIINEPNMPAYKDVVPYITCSLFDDWDIFFDWSKRFLEKKIIVTDDIKNKVSELTKGCADDEERVAKIYYYIQRKIRYISIKSGIGSGYSGHPAADTLHNEYGDCIDKAILFTTMLKVLDIPSYPIILKTNNSNEMERRLPGFDSNHAITKVVLNGRDIFLDSTAENFRYPYFQTADHGIFGINSLEKKFEYIPIPPPEDNAELSVNYCSINENGDFEVDSTSSFTGQSESNNRYYVKHIKDTDLKRYITNYLNSLSPGSRLKYFSLINMLDFSNPFYSDMGYILKDYGITAGDLVILSIPNIEMSFNEIALEERKYPLEFTSSFQEKKEFIIDLNGKYTVKYLPEPMNIDTDYFSFNMEYKEEDGKIIFTEDYKRKKRIVPLEDYDEYRERHKKIERRLKDKIFLTKAE
jgi:transglutaminase-like putative cysteine protease